MGRGEKPIERSLMRQMRVRGLGSRGMGWSEKPIERSLMRVRDKCE